MWYGGYNGSNWQVLYANSSNGMNWTKQGVVLSTGADGEYDDIYAYTPCVIKTDEYEMWYTGRDGITEQILYANSSDGISWNSYGLVLGRLALTLLCIPSQRTPQASSGRTNFSGKQQNETGKYG